LNGLGADALRVLVRPHPVAELGDLAQLGDGPKRDTAHVALRIVLQPDRIVPGPVFLPGLHRLADEGDGVAVLVIEARPGQPLVELWQRIAGRLVIGGVIAPAEPLKTEAVCIEHGLRHGIRLSAGSNLRFDVGSPSSGA
jgi:hypothetical protein